MSDPVFAYQFLKAKSLAASFSSDLTTNIPFNYIEKSNVAFQLVWTGTPTGSFDFQVSLNYSPVTGIGDWTSLGITTAAPTGAAGNAFVDLNQVTASFVRVVYNYTSGTGTVNGYIVAKEV